MQNYSLIATRKPRLNLLLFIYGLALISVFGLAEKSSAQISNWNSASGAWFTPGNWSPSGVPSSNATVQISNGATARISGGNASIGSILLGPYSGGTWGNILITSNGTLTTSDSTANTYIAYSGYAAGPLTSSVTVDGAGSLWAASNAGVTVGFNSNTMGTLTLQNGGQMTNTKGLYISSYTVGSNGTVTVTGAGSQYNSSTDGMRVGTAGVGVLNISAGGVVSSTFAIAGQNAGSSGTITVDGAGSIWKSTSATTMVIGTYGAGTVILQNGGNVNVANGTVSMALADQAGSTGTLKIGNGNAAGTLTAARVVGNSGTAAVIFGETDASYTFATILGGALSVTQSGPGCTVLTSGNNTYSGNTTVTAGALSIATTGDLAGWNTNGRYSVFSGATLAVYNAVSDGNVTTMLGTTNFAAGSALGFDTTTANRTYSVVLANTAQGSLGLAKLGANTLTLSNANTYTGLTTVSNGILQASVDQSLGTAAAGTTVSAGAALILNNVNYATGEALTINGTGISGGGALVNNGTSTFAGQVTASTNSTINTGGGTLNLTGGLVKNGTVLTLAGGGIVNVSGVAISGASANSDLVVDGTTANLNVANTYNGPTYLRNGGVINATVTNALPTTNGRSAIIMDDSGSGSSNLELTNVAQSVASLTGASSSTVHLNANTLTVGAGSGATTFAGVISGTNGSLIKDNGSTQVLGGANSYTGATTVSSGTLLINGSTSSSSAVNVSSGATLGGNGTAAGVVTVTGGTLSPGNGGPGILTVGSLSLDSSSTTHFEINDIVSAGTDYDHVVVNTSAGLTLNGAFTINFGNVLALPNTTNINLFQYTGGHTGDFTSLASLGFYTSAGWNHVGETFTYNTGTQVLTFSETNGNLNIYPEPQTWALLAFSLTTVMVLRRRRRN